MKELVQGDKIYRKYRCTVLSDLHLFSRDDSKEKTSILGRELLRQIIKCDKIILNGDIFEIEMGKWGVKGTIDVATEYLDKMLSSDYNAQKYRYKYQKEKYHKDNEYLTPEERASNFWKNKELVFIPGNHDCREEFSKKLEKLSEKYPYFKFAPDGYKIDGILITHGDKELRKSNKLYADLYAKGDPFYKRNFIKGFESSRGGQWIALAYGLLENTVIKIHDDFFHKAKDVAKFIVNAYADQPEYLKDIHTIITGHTHIPFFNQVVKFFDKEIAVHNTGSPRISSLEKEGLNFLPLRFTYKTQSDLEGNLICENAHVNNKYMQKFVDKMNELIKASRKTYLPDNFIEQLSGLVSTSIKRKEPVEKDPHMFI